MDHVRATEVAARIGQGLALLFAFLGLFSNPLLIFIGLFVWLAATEEASLVQVRSALDGIPVARVMITDFRTLRPDEPLARAVEYARAGFQQDFPVVEDGRLVGVLTRRRPDRRAGTSRCGGPRRGRHATRLRHGRPAGDAADRPRATTTTAIATRCPSCRTATSWGL